MNKIFPNPNSASEEGVLAIGGEYSAFMLLEAYSNGIFPWPSPPEYPYLWFSPDPRTIIDFKNFRINRTTKKIINKKKYKTIVNHNFREVVNLCKKSLNRKDGPSTWITKELEKGFVELHQNGLAYSVSSINESGKTVGGVFGVKLPNVCSAESMFYLEDGASKYALVSAIEYLKSERYSWVDIQMVTPLTKSFGATNIERSDFLERIKTTDQKL